LLEDDFSDFLNLIDYDDNSRSWRRAKVWWPCLGTLGHRQKRLMWGGDEGFVLQD
jgi:hypothetical protein